MAGYSTTKVKKTYASLDANTETAHQSEQMGDKFIVLNKSLFENEVEVTVTRINQFVSETCIMYSNSVMGIGTPVFMLSSKHSFTEKR